MANEGLGRDSLLQMGVSKNNGTPKMDGLWWKILLKMDDLGGPPLFLEIPKCYEHEPITRWKLFESRPSPPRHFRANPSRQGSPRKFLRVKKNCTVVLGGTFFVANNKNTMFFQKKMRNTCSTGDV